MPLPKALFCSSALSLLAMNFVRSDTSSAATPMIAPATMPTPTPTPTPTPAAAAAQRPSSGPKLRARQQPLSVLPIAERVHVPKGPAWLETGFGSLWVSKSASKVVLRIDPATNRVIATIPVGSDAELGIGIGMDSLWIADPKDRSLTRIDPSTNRVIKVYPVPLPTEAEGSIGVSMDSIWLLTNENGTRSGTLSRFDPVSGKIIANIKVRPHSHAALAAFDSVWVTSTGDGTVTRVDPATNAVSAEIHVHPGPRFLGAGMDSVWVVSQGDGSLARIDPRTNAVTATIELNVPGPGGDISIGEGYVWVSAEGIPITQIDPATNTMLRQFVGGKKDDTLRVGFGAAWVVDELKGEIWRANVDAISSLPLP